MGRATYFKVGVMTFLGLVLLFGGYVFLRQYTLGKTRHHYVAAFKGITRLTQGGVVTIMGVPRGLIDRLEVRGESVFVHFHLDNEYLREGAWAQVETQSLVGQYRLTLFPGTGAVLPEGSVIPGENPFGLDQLFTGVGRLLEGMDTIFTRVQATLDTTTAHLSAVMDSLQRGFVDLRRLVRVVEQTLRENQGSVDSTLLALRVLALRTDSVLALLQHGEGSVQRLLREDSLYRDLRSTLQSLDSLLKDLRENPKRYVHFSLF